MAKRASRISRPSSSVNESVDTQATTTDMLRQAQEAIDAYDYELARNLLERAVSLSGGSTEPALALLTLLVDHLVADEDALAIWPNLSSEARGSNEIRALLALAAARMGDVSRAKQLVGGIDGSRAADVLTLLATNVLESGDWAAAGKLADDARARDPAHPGAREVTERVAHTRVVERSRLEDEMTFALELGNRDEALRLAESIVAVFPESAAARQLLRAATDERRHEDAKQRVGNAEEALARGDLDTALQWLRRAEQVLATSSGSDALRAHITMLEAEAKARALATTVAEISALLSNDTKSGLLRYGSADEEVRVEVRKTNSLPPLDALERILQKRVKVDEAVSAVLDLVKAVDAVDRDPKSALDMIAMHERILAGIADTTKVQARARELLENERVRRVSAVLDAARSAIDNGNAQGALDMLASIDTHDVRASERERMDALRHEANTIIERRSLEQRYEQLLSSEPLAACEVAEQILARPDSNRIQWQEAMMIARRNARRVFGVWVADDIVMEAPKAIDGPVEIDLDVPMKSSPSLHEVLQWMDPEARTFVMTEAHDRWVFVRCIQAATGKIQSRVILRMPERMGDVDAMVTKSHTLYMVSESAAIFEISMESWDPIFWRSSRELISTGEVVDDAKLVPDSRFVWIHSRRDDNSSRTRILDAQRRRMTRELEGIWTFVWVADSHGARMVCSGAREQTTLHDMRGAPILERHPLPKDRFLNAVVHPSGHGMLVLSGTDDELVKFEEVGHGPNAQANKWRGTTEAWHSSILATSLRRRNAYFIATTKDDPVIFEEIGFVGGTLQRRLATTLDATPHIVQDQANQNVFALFEDGRRLHLVPLTEQVPDVPQISHRRKYLPNPFVPYGCSFSGDRGAETIRFVDTLKHYSPSVQLERLEDFAASLILSPVDLFDTHRMLLSMNHPALASRLLSWMQDHMPEELYTLLIRAINALQESSFQEAIGLFERLPFEAIAEKHRRHVYHEFGMALIRAGQFERAIPVLHEGMRAGEGRCGLQDLLDLVEPLPEEIENPFAPILIRIRQAVRHCDFWLDNGEFGRALEAVDVLDIWESLEVQSLARLAFAYLRFDPRDDAERFRKALALARFLGEHRVIGSMRNELIVDNAKWPKSKLDEIETQASRWLEGLA